MHLGEDLLVLGALFVIAYVLGRLGKQIGLPAIPIYMVVGLLASPFTGWFPISFADGNYIQLIAVFGLVLLLFNLGLEFDQDEFYSNAGKLLISGGSYILINMVEAPEGFEVLARTTSTPVAAFANASRGLYGVQWHPEVKHTQYGQDVIENFLHRAAGIPADWNPGNVIADQVAAIRAQVGKGRVICALSGGVDSAVAGALVHAAVGDQLVCVFVDHGLLREGERRQVEEDYVASTGVRLVTVDARERFLTALAGVSDPEEKRKIIGREFIRTRVR